MTGIDREIVRQEVRGARAEILRRIEVLSAFRDLDLAREALASLNTCEDWLAEHLEEADQESLPQAG